MLNKMKFLWETKPTYLIYWVSQSCNFTCDHCFNHEENKRKTRQLSLEEVGRIASSFGHIKYLTLAGGEPFLRQDLLDLSAIFVSRNDLHHLNIVTNGWYGERILQFCRAFCERFPRVQLTLNVSLDGFEEEHDRVRRRPGSFKAAVEAVEKLKSIRSGSFEVAVNSVYHAANASNLEEFGNWVISALEVPFVINLLRGPSIQNEDLREFSAAHYFALARRLHRKNIALRNTKAPAGFERLVSGVQLTALDAIETSVRDNRMALPCQAGKKGVVMKADGEILLCEILGTSLGNIRDHDYDIGRMLGLPDCQAKLSDIRTSRCHCSWECFQSLNVVFAPRLYPKVTARAFGLNI